MSYIDAVALSLAFRLYAAIILSFYQIGSQRTFHNRDGYAWRLVEALDSAVDSSAVLSGALTLLYASRYAQRTHTCHRYDNSVSAIKASGHVPHASRQADCQSV